MTPLPNRFTATPDPVPAGDTLKICFDNPALAGTTITVQLDNGGSLTDTADIDLDEEGKGCTNWTVPGTGWDAVVMNQATSAENVVLVS